VARRVCTRQRGRPTIDSFPSPNRFTDNQALAVKERLLTIAQMLEVVGLGRPMFPRPEDALKHTPPMRLEDVNEVIYSFM
jgi:hypothetical protein